MDKTELLSLLQRANAAEVGIVVRSNAPERLRTRLYPLIRETAISLSLHVRGESELWLVKKPVGASGPSPAG